MSVGGYHHITHHGFKHLFWMEAVVLYFGASLAILLMGPRPHSSSMRDRFTGLLQTSVEQESFFFFHTGQPIPAKCLIGKQPGRPTPGGADPRQGGGSRASGWFSRRQTVRRTRPWAVLPLHDQAPHGIKLLTAPIAPTRWLRAPVTSPRFSLGLVKTTLLIQHPQ